ncbi:glutathione S-transferase A-like [Branchiostoma lanceolatum]|uniref:glutathione S-transferase A-like n=1 Tax=Branchiostoma lanceolatum TaxID=7740 RepID=UPI0034518A61
MSETAEVTLYYASGSVPSLSLMILLEEKGIEYTTKEVDLDKPSKEFKKLSHREEVPVLKYGDIVLPEFLAACIYLEETFGGTKLIPDDITSEALVLQRMFSAQNIGVGDTTICSYWADDDEEEGGGLSYVNHVSLYCIYCQLVSIQAPGLSVIEVLSW